MDKKFMTHAVKFVIVTSAVIGVSFAALAVMVAVTAAKITFGF